MYELKVNLTEEEKTFLSQYAQVYNDERKRDGTMDPIVLVQSKVERLVDEGEEHCCKYSLFINDTPYTEEELFDENQVMGAISDFIEENKETFLETFLDEEIEDLFDEIVDAFHSCYSIEWKDHVFSWNAYGVEFSIEIEKYFIGHHYNTVAYFFTRKEAKKYIRSQEHNLNQPRIFTDYAGRNNEGDYPTLQKLLLRMGHEINKKDT